MKLVMKGDNIMRKLWIACLGVVMILGLVGCGTESGKTAEKAADALKEYVMQEMDKRSGVQRTGKESAKAMVRFDDFKTDQRYALIHCSFRVVY